MLLASLFQTPRHQQERGSFDFRAGPIAQVYVRRRAPHTLPSFQSEMYNWL